MDGSKHNESVTLRLVTPYVALPHIPKTVVAISGCLLLLERRSQRRQFSQGRLPLVFCPLCRRCLAACSFLLLVTSECQATLRALLSFLFRFGRHLFAPSSVLIALYPIRSPS